MPLAVGSSSLAPMSTVPARLMAASMVRMARVLCRSTA